MTAPVSTQPPAAARPPAAPGGDRPGQPSPRDQAQPGPQPWTIVAIWGVFLAILSAVGAAMGNSLVVLEISGGAATGVLAIAGAVWLDHRLRPSRGVYSLPVRLGGTFLFAVTADMAWMALAFGEVMLMLAVVPLAGAIGLEIAARRARRHR